MLCGTGDKLEGYKARVKTLGLSNVLFPGWVGKPESYELLGMSSAGLAPYPARSDFLISIPNKIVEYLSAGLPILSSLPGKLERLLAEEGCGLTYHNQDPSDFIDKIMTLHGNSSLHEAMAKRATMLFNATFDASKVFREMANYLEEIAGQPPGEGVSLENKQLLETLSTMQAARDEEWLKGLPKRKIDEIEHHNLQRDKEINKDLPQDTYELLHGNQKFYATTQASNDYLYKWMATNVAGKVFLDYACGNGQQVIQAAQGGAAIAIGIDLRDVSIINARQAAEKAGVAQNCFFIQGDCENTGLPNDCIDVILCGGVLHHMDLTAAFPEMQRILKRGGKALALEALNYNPAIRLYRKITPHMRTEWEKNHILSMRVQK